MIIALAGRFEFRSSRASDYAAVKKNQAAWMPRTIRSEGLLALGRAIAEIRAAQGMTQKQFGASIGWDDSVIAKIELGIRRLDVVELVLLARAMNVDAAELLRKVEEATPWSRRG